MTEIKRVLVTGAGGTVGNYVVKELLLSGYEVTATDLKADFMKEWRKEWYECRRKGDSKQLGIFPGDLRDRNFVEEMFRATGKFDAVIHSAALVDISLPKDILFAVNFEAVKNLYKVACENRVKVFVHLSSGAIYDVKGILTETTRVRASNHYEASKIATEMFLERRACYPDSPKIFVLRPSLIYGPKNKFLAANYLAIAIALGKNLGKVLPRLWGGPRTNLVHAEDVSRAAVFLMECGKKPHCKYAEFYNISDNSPMGFGDQLHAIAQACGYKGNFLPLILPPARLMRLVHLVYESPIFLKGLNSVLRFFWSKLVREYNLKEEFKPEISREMTPFFGQDTIFSNEKIHSLGFRLKYPLFKYGVRDVVDWYRKNKWIP